MANAAAVSRRNFLKTGGVSSAALVIGFYWPALAGAQASQEAPKVNPFNAWIRIDRDGRATLIAAKSEMGQGVRTTLPMILADELEIEWPAVRVEQAPTDTKIYPDLGTGGSGSTKESWLPLRQAGAAAREMLIAAAAQTWGVDRQTCHAEKGAVYHGPRTKRLTYGELVETAAKLPIPNFNTVTLKNPDNFHIVGTSVPREDIPGKVNGSAVFGIDVRAPGMLYAVIARCPTFGGKVAHFDAAKAKAIPGVRQVVEIPAVGPHAHTAGGIAVVADTTAAAMAGRDALEIEWDREPYVQETSEALREQLQAAVQNPGKLIHNVGDAEAQLSGVVKKVEAGYELPFLAHATMEPMNCTADVREDRAEVWAPTQSPDWIQSMVAGIAKLPRESVAVHTTLMGGGFGRRYHSDFGVEAAQVSKAAGKPVQVLWTREDDMQHDFYRPAFHHRLSAALDEHGNISAWRHRIASTSIRVFWDPPDKVKPEAQEIGGAAFPPYAIPNFRVEYAPVATVVPRAWWRSVEDSSSGFVVESFIDELAASAGVDPLQFRLGLLKEDRKIPNVMWPNGRPLDTRRFRNTLQLAADKAGWGKPLPAGQARGIAGWYSFDTYVAEVAEVSVEKNGRVRVHRVVCAVDCGRAVHPDGIASQMESGIIYGLSAALMGEITIAGGAVKQSNFNDYPVLRMREVPKIEVHIVPSVELPTGTGEPGLPPAAPAVTNAIFVATGKRVRRLPIRAEDLRPT